MEGVKYAASGFSQLQEFQIVEVVSNKISMTLVQIPFGNPFLSISTKGVRRGSIYIAIILLPKIYKGMKIEMKRKINKNHICCVECALSARREEVAAPAHPR